MKCLGLAEALADPRFSDWDTRRENAGVLRDMIEDALAQKSAREWESILDPAGAPCACIWKIEDVINHRQVQARSALQQLSSPFGALRLAGVGFQLNEGGGRLDRMAPRLGEHNAEILSGAGYSPSEVDTLRTEGVI